MCLVELSMKKDLLPSGLTRNDYHGIVAVPMPAYFQYPSRYSCNLSDCHTLPDSANGPLTDSRILCPFMSVRMRFLSVCHAVHAFRVR